MTTAWMDRAECRPGSGHDPDLWFDGNRRAEAQRICRDCPVRGVCQQVGRDFDAFRGVWGGEDHRADAPGMSPTAPYLGYEHGTDAGYSAHLREGTPPCGRCQTAHMFKNRHYAGVVSA